MEEEKRKCLYCGEPIYGRLDKKFCCDSCRNSYNYERTHKQTNLVRNINAILARNYAILQELNTTGKTSVAQRQLTERNFDFRYFTHLYKTKTGSVYYIVYDQAYLPKDGSSDSYLLVKFEEKQ